MKWNLEKRKLSDLKFYEKNPRRLGKKQSEELKTSLEKYGVCQPVVINQDNVIIGGHQRVRSLKKLKQREVEVYVPDRMLEPKEVEELNIRLNKNVGDWDFDVLANTWDESDLLEWGFDEKELGFDYSPDMGEEQEEEKVSKIPKNPKTKLGDIYQLGDHRVICGDSTCAETVENLLEGEKPILMVTDPPYGVNYDASVRGEAKAFGKVFNDDRLDWTEAWKFFPGSVAYVWCAFLPEVAQSLEKNGFERKNLIVWVKQMFTMSRGDYHWKHETCWYSVKKGQKSNWQGSRKETTVWEIDNLNPFGRKKESYENNEATGHSTQKPLECMAKPIRNNSAKGEIVYDPFLGSGTTLIAAEVNSRKCYGLELAPEYCDVIVDRWVNHRMKNNLEYQVIKNGKPVDWGK